jgi:tetratricopeptide (TPR) repeat protein
MSLLMDALRRAEAEKRQQEARATRATPAATAATPANEPAASHATSYAEQAREFVLDDPGDSSTTLTSAALELEPLEALADDPHERSLTFGERPLGTATLPSVRSMRRDVDAYFDQSLSMEAPRSARDNETTQDNASGYTVVSAQTVFSAAERSHTSRVVVIATVLAVAIVVGAAGLGIYYARLRPTPQVMPSPAVAADVEKPTPREVAVVSLDEPPAAPAELLPRVAVAPPMISTTPAAVAAAITAPTSATAANTDSDDVAALPAPATAAPATSAQVAPSAQATPASVEPLAASAIADPPAARAKLEPSDLEWRAGDVRISRSRSASAAEDLGSRAYRAYVAGDLTAAQGFYSALRAQAPGDRDALLGLAAIAQQRGDVALARAYYSEVLHHHHDDAVAVTALIALAGDASAASGATLRALRDQYPGAAFVHAALGDWQTRNGAWRDAQLAYFDAVRLDGGNADYAHNLAVSLDHLGEARAALVYYRKCLELAAEPGTRIDVAQVRRRIDELGQL